MVDMSSSAPYKINWIDLSVAGYPASVCIGGLPGFKQRTIQRDTAADLAELKANNVSHIVLLCDTPELERFGASIELYSTELQLHHYPCRHDQIPDIAAILDILRLILGIVECGDKCLIASRDGLGRSCLIGGIVMLNTNDALTHADIFAFLKQNVDRRAVQTVKQYNMLLEFRELRDEYIANSALHNNATTHDRHLSR